MTLIAYTEPDDQGGRMFQADDGAEFYFYGPEAEQLAAEIGRQPDLRLAINDAPPDAPPVDFGGVTDLQNQWATDAAPPPEQQRRDVPMLQKRRDVPAPPAMPTLPGSGAPPPVPMAAPEPVPTVLVGGSAGVDPERMKRRGVFVPTEETVSEAIPVDPELQAVRQGISAEEQALRMNMAETQAAKARATELQAAAALPELEMRAAEAQHQQRQIERLYEEERADIGAMLEEHRGRTVDPKRYWKQGGAFGETMNFLGIILGALASGVSGVHGAVTPNVALEMFNRQSELDIQLQQEEIERDGVDAKNALALLQHRFGDVEQAKDALKLAMLDVADMQAKELTASYGTQEAAQAYAAWNVEHMKEREALERKIRDASIGKHATKFKFTQPVAPSAARRVPVDQLPIDKQAKFYKSAAEIEKAKATIRGGGVDPDIAAKEAARAGAAARVENTKSTQELGKALAETEEARRTFEDTIAAAGLRYNADTGKVEGYEGDIPGVGLHDKHVPDLLAGEKGRKVRQNLRNTIDMVIRARTGAAAPPAEVDKIEAFVIGAGTEKEFMDGMQMLAGQLQSINDMHRARFGPGAVKQLETNRAGVERARSDKAKAADVEPY